MEKETYVKLKHILFLRTILTGIFGGLFSGMLFLVMHLLKMMQLSPIMMLNWLFQDGKWLDKWYAYFIFLLLFSLLSTIIALIYYFFFKTRKSWVAGAIFGMITWSIFYFVLPVVIKNYNPFVKLASETHIAMFCLFVLYGVFTGYTISYDYENLKEEYE